MSDPILRRGFLRQLCGLPMLGGGVALLGAPTAVAEPVTSGMLDAYRSFLIGELNLVERERPRELFAPYLPCPQSQRTTRPIWCGPRKWSLCMRSEGEN